MNRHSIFFLFSVVLSVYFVLVGCGKDNQATKHLIALIPEEVTEVAVTHILSGKETKYTATGAKLGELKLWASNLSMKHKVYKGGSTPGDVDGGSKDKNPMYIRLVRANIENDYIDIRTDDIENFISK
jgi:hypothetical protein